MRIKLLTFLSLLFRLLFSYEPIAKGIVYEHFVTDVPRQSIHVLLVDPNEVSITFGAAHEKCASSEKTTSIAKRYNAIAAINGGFFDFGCKNKIQDTLIRIFDCLGYSKYRAFPEYTLLKQNNYYALSHVFTGAIGWDSNNQCPVFGIIKSDIVLTMNGRAYEVHELNKPHPKKLTLYSDCYDQKTPSLSECGDEIVIQDNCIKEIHRFSMGNTEIPKQGWIYVIPKNYKHLTDTMQKGDQVLIQCVHQQDASNSDIVYEDISNKEHIVASTPLLICNGHINKKRYA